MILFKNDSKTLEGVIKNQKHATHGNRSAERSVKEIMLKVGQESFSVISAGYQTLICIRTFFGRKI